MFIAVPGYKQSNALEKQDEILILDTSDGSIELVRSYDILKSEIFIENIVKDYTSMQCAVWQTNLAYSMSNIIGKETDMLRMISDNAFIFDGKTYTIECSRSEKARINGVRLRLSGTTISLSYIFKFRGMHVLRFRALGEPSDYWYSAVPRKDGGFDQWSSDFDICMNKKVAMYIDTTSRI